MLHKNKTWFTASSDAHQMETEFEGLVDALQGFCEAQGLACKVQVLPAAKLTPAQSKAVAVTVPTVNWRRPQVTVGQVALYGDFLSQRLMLMCENGRPLHIAAGTLVDVTKMIGCCIEHQRLNVKNNK